MEITKSLKYYKKILDINCVNIKLIKIIPNLKVIKTVDVTKSELFGDDYYIFKERNNAISNILINFKHIKSYKINVGGVNYYDVVEKINCVLQNNYQIIPCVLNHDINIKFEFIKPELLNDNDILFSYDILDYNGLLRNFDYKMKLNKFKNIVLRECFNDKIYIGHRIYNSNIVKIYPGSRFQYDFKKYAQFCVHGSLNIINVWVENKNKNKNKYFLKLINNLWVCDLTQIPLKIHSIFIEFKNASMDEYLTFNYIYCNSVSNDGSMSWLHYSW